MSTRAKYFLVWSVNSLEKRHDIEESPLFIGRLPYSYRDKIQGYQSLQVYIHYPATEKTIPTNFFSATVSRYHIKLVEENGRFFIIDHGSTGKGSRNGTYVNGEKIPPGQKILLRPGDSFRLGRRGPVFTIVLKRAGEDTIVLQKGVPTIMPKTLAVKLATIKGIQVENYDKNTALVLASFKGSKNLGNLIVYSQEPSKREQQLKKLFQIENILIDALEYLKEHRDTETAKTIISKLKLEAYQELIREINEKEITKTYTELIKIIAIDLLDPPAIEKRIKQLIHLIREYVKNH